MFNTSMKMPIKKESWKLQQQTCLLFHFHTTKIRNKDIPCNYYNYYFYK
jgi:hypothetical protein